MDGKDRDNSSAINGTLGEAKRWNSRPGKLRKRRRKISRSGLINKTQEKEKKIPYARVRDLVKVFLLVWQYRAATPRNREIPFDLLRSAVQR